MGFRNPFRIQVDSKGIAYITDYSPDSQIPQTLPRAAGHGPRRGRARAGQLRLAAVHDAERPVLPVELQHRRTPLDPANPQPFECDNPAKGPDNESRWNTGATIDPTAAPGRVQTPRLTQPDIWYSYRDNQNPPSRARRASRPTTGPPEPPARGICPQLFPELFTGGVGPHGATTYEFDPNNPSETKFPPYYDGATLLGEFTQDTMREIRFDSSNQVLEINPFLNCGRRSS